MKRFYTKVALQDVGDGWQVTLDGRGVKTAGGIPQTVRPMALAKALADEWEAQGDELDPTTLPLRDMVDYALDIVSSDSNGVIDTVLSYGDTDTLLYRADPDEPLHARQQEVWDPLVTAFEAEHGVTMTPISGVMHRDQDPQTMATLRATLNRFDPLALAGVEMMASLAASLIVALSATRTDTDPLELWAAASLEENWQADLWGRDDEAEKRRSKRQAAFLKAREMTVLSLSV